MKKLESLAVITHPLPSALTTADLLSVSMELPLLGIL
jgi:hypothetical protein